MLDFILIISKSAANIQYFPETQMHFRDLFSLLVVKFDDNSVIL